LRNRFRETPPDTPGRDDRQEEDEDVVDEEEDLPVVWTTLVAML